MSSEHVEALFGRGLILLEQRRYDQAELYFREAIGLDPERSSLYYQLAVSQALQSQIETALKTLDEALRLEPTTSNYFAYRSSLLALLERPMESLEAASEAISLDPFSSYAFLSQAYSMKAFGDWQSAENAVRQALDRDPDYLEASKLLAYLLRMQNRIGEASGQILQTLSRHPEDPESHAEAGWIALEQDDNSQAEFHFLESLRVDPGNMDARSGLIESFRMRSPFYSSFRRFCLFTLKSQVWVWIVLIALYAFSDLAGPALDDNRIFWSMLGIPSLFILWASTSRPLGNLAVLKDVRARHGLSKEEQWEALIVAGGLVAGLFFLALSLVVPFKALLALGAGCLGMLIPGVHIATNQSAAGRFVFGGICLYIVFVSILYALAVAIPGLMREELLLALGIIGVLASVASIWLANKETF